MRKSTKVSHERNPRNNREQPEFAESLWEWTECYADLTRIQGRVAGRAGQKFGEGDAVASASFRAVPVVIDAKWTPPPTVAWKGSFF